VSLVGRPLDRSAGAACLDDRSLCGVPSRRPPSPGCSGRRNVRAGS